MYKCNDCKAVFEEPGKDSELIGKWGDRPIPEDYDVCPECGSTDFEEVQICEICGEVANDIICDSCLNDYVTLDNALVVGDMEKETIEINNVIQMVFTPEEINDILKNEVKSKLELYEKVGSSMTPRSIASDYFYDNPGLIYENLKKLKKKEIFNGKIIENSN